MSAVLFSFCIQPKAHGYLWCAAPEQAGCGNCYAIVIFADDIKIYMEIDNKSQTALFQEYINIVSSWADERQLKLSYNKCHYWRVSLRKCDTSACYLLNNVSLSRVTFCTDLGVCVGSVLPFSEHINNVVTKAKQRTNLLLRSFLSKDAMLLTKAFAVYVRPHGYYSGRIITIALTAVVTTRQSTFLLILVARPKSRIHGIRGNREFWRFAWVAAICRTFA